MLHSACNLHSLQLLKDHVSVSYFRGWSNQFQWDKYHLELLLRVRKQAKMFISIKHGAMFPLFSHNVSAVTGAKTSSHTVQPNSVIFTWRQEVNPSHDLFLMNPLLSLSARWCLSTNLKNANMNEQLYCKPLRKLWCLNI